MELPSRQGADLGWACDGWRPAVEHNGVHYTTRNIRNSWSRDVSFHSISCDIIGRSFFITISLQTDWKYILIEQMPTQTLFQMENSVFCRTWLRLYVKAHCNTCNAIRCHTQNYKHIFLMLCQRNVHFKALNAGICYFKCRNVGVL